MTQAFNLSQLANNVNTSGDLNAAVGLYNQVPVANGGTGAATLTANAVLIGNGTSAVTAVAASTAGNVLTSNGTTWTSAANPASSGVNAVTVGVASGTWTKPATVKSIKVTVVGGGGNGGTGTAAPSPVPGARYGLGGGGGGGGTAIRFYPAASIPGPQPYTVGGAGATSSFGVAPITVISATGGAAGTSVPSAEYVGPGGNGGVGSNGSVNSQGNSGKAGHVGANTKAASGEGGGSTLCGGANAVKLGIPAGSIAGLAAGAYGGGGSGGIGFASTTGTSSAPGGAGSAGVVIIEEFY
jgi:hypothetical protein